MRKLLFVIAVLVNGWSPFTQAADNPNPAETRTDQVGRLVYFYSEFCHYCKSFDRQVGSVYHKTAMAKRLPLVAVNLFDPPDEWDELSGRVGFTPTFILLNNQGQEVERIRGFTEEELFWGRLETAVRHLQPPKTTSAVQGLQE